MSELFRGTNKDYGEYRCSCCGKPLNVSGNSFGSYYNAVGKESDEEGYEWRGFDDACFERIKVLTNEQILKIFNPSTFIKDEDDSLYARIIAAVNKRSGDCGESEKDFYPEDALLDIAQYIIACPKYVEDIDGMLFDYWADYPWAAGSEIVKAINHFSDPASDEDIHDALLKFYSEYRKDRTQNYKQLINKIVLEMFSKNKE